MICSTSWIKDCTVFLNIYKLVFSLLTNWRDTNSYSCRTFIIIFKNLLSVDAKIVVPSTYAKLFILELYLGMPHLMYLQSSNKTFRARDSISGTIMNKAGDKGSPWSIPLVKCKNPWDWILISMKYQLLAIKHQIKSIKFSENLSSLIL